MGDYRARFRLVHFDGDPDDVTGRLGLEPTDAWADPDDEGRHAAWVLDSPTDAAAPLDRQIEALLGLLESRADAVRAEAARSDAFLAILGEEESTYVGGTIRAEHLERIGRLGLHLDVDLLAYPPLPIAPADAAALTVTREVDAERGGAFLEARTADGDVVLEVFRADDTGAYTVWAEVQELPLELLEALVDRARRELG